MGKLRAWLKPNPLTADPTDYTAVVKTSGNLGVADIVNEMKDDGMEFQPETVTDIIQRFCRKAAERVTDGYCINMGLVNMRPVVRGSFPDRMWNEGRNSVRIAVSPGVLLRRAAAEAEVEIVGQQPSPISIISIKDLTTGRMDGLLTRGRAAELRGSYLKIMGADPAVGITFRHIETGVMTRLTPGEIVVNYPSRLVILVPDSLPDGTYSLTLTTQFTSIRAKLLSIPRSITFKNEVVIR